MCGIAGVYNQKNNKLIEAKIVEAMLKKIEHRGPDGSQIKMFDPCALGFNRLSFLDLEGGMQPIGNEDGSVYMICNGEIFNFNELREELISKGHVFKTGGDNFFSWDYIL